MEEIKILYEPLKTVYNIHSYSGKHYIERYRDYIKIDNTYISNGEFIVAMLLSGYKYKYNYKCMCALEYKSTYKYRVIKHISIR